MPFNDENAQAGDTAASFDVDRNEDDDMSLYFSCDAAGSPSVTRPTALGNVADRYLATTVARPNNACPDPAERGSNWTQFLRIVDLLSRVSDATAAGACRSTPTDVPALGDLIYSVARLLVLPNALESCPSSCTSDAATRLGGVALDNHIVRDLFVLSVRRFTEIYLSELVQSCDSAQRARIFQVKTWLTCRLHFDHQLIDSLSQAVPTVDGTRSVTRSEARQLVEKSVTNATNGRLVFRDSPNRGPATLSRVETFSPTFALFTLCNMRDEYAATSHAQQYRFDRDDADANVGRPPSVQDCLMLYGTVNTSPSVVSSSSVHRGGRVATALDGGGGIFRPNGRHGKRAAIVTTNSSASNSGSVNSLWPEQKLLANARGYVNRDRTLQRFVGAACAEKSSSSSLSTKDTIAVADATTATSADRTITPGVSDAIKMFDRHDHYESRFRSDRTVVPLARGFDAYRSLLERLTLAWAKLNFLEPSIFT